MSEACYCDYNPPDFFSESMHTARKAHRCSECGRAIDVGEQYENTTGKWDGDFSTFKTCLRCRAVREYVVEHVPCFCWAYGNMLQDARDTVSEYARELPGLWVGFGRLLLAATTRRVPRVAA